MFHPSAAEKFGERSGNVFATRNIERRYGYREAKLY